MLTNLRHLKISSVFIYLILLLSCSEEKDTLEHLSLITNKKVILNDTKINSASAYKFKGDFYPLEVDTYFDANGKIIKSGHSKGEGLLFYYRNPNKSQLKLNKEQLELTIRLDKVNNCIIENDDTIRNLTVDLKNRIAYSENNKENRINIYRFE